MADGTKISTLDLDFIWLIVVMAAEFLDWQEPNIRLHLPDVKHILIVFSDLHLPIESV